MSKPKYTEEVGNHIVAALQAGAFLHVAAQSVGISKQTLSNWLHSPKPIYKEFQRRVAKAIAEARLMAEMNVFKEDPKFWLRCGPGRERIEKDGTVLEGWTEAVQPNKEREASQVNILMSPEWAAIQRILLEVLADVPAIREKLAQALTTINHQPALPTD